MMEKSRNKRGRTEKGAVGRHESREQMHVIASKSMFNQHLQNIFSVWCFHQLWRAVCQVSWWTEPHFHQQVCRCIRLQRGHLTPSSGPRYELQNNSIQGLHCGTEELPIKILVNYTFYTDYCCCHVKHKVCCMCIIHDMDLHDHIFHPLPNLYFYRLILGYSSQSLHSWLFLFMAL